MPVGPAMAPPHSAADFLTIEATPQPSRPHRDAPSGLPPPVGAKAALFAGTRHFVGIGYICEIGMSLEDRLHARLRELTEEARKVREGLKRQTERARTGRELPSRSDSGAHRPAVRRKSPPGHLEPRGTKNP